MIETSGSGDSDGPKSRSMSDSIRFGPSTEARVADHPIHREWCEVPLPDCTGDRGMPPARRSSHRSRDNGGTNPGNIG